MLSEEALCDIQSIETGARKAGFEASIQHVLTHMPGHSCPELRAALRVLCTMLSRRYQVADVSMTLRASILGRLRPLTGSVSERDMILQLRGYLHDLELLSEAQSLASVNSVWCKSVGWPAHQDAAPWLRTQLSSIDDSVCREAAVSLAMLDDASGLDKLRDGLPTSWMNDYASLISAVGLCRLGHEDGIRFVHLSAAECLNEPQSRLVNYLANVRNAVDRVELDLSTSDSEWWLNYLKLLESRRKASN